MMVGTDELAQSNTHQATTARRLARNFPAARTGAQLILSDEGDADWKYAFAAQDGARLVPVDETPDLLVALVADVAELALRHLAELFG